MADRPSELELQEENVGDISKKKKEYKLLILILGSNLFIAGAIVGIILFTTFVIPESWKFWWGMGTGQGEQKIAVQKAKKAPKAAAEELINNAFERPTEKDQGEAILQPYGEPTKKGPDESTQKAAKMVQGYIFKMDPFLANLADADKPKYLRIRINLESTESKPNEEYEKRLPQLRDAILTILSSKRQKDIFESEGKQKLREEMVTQLNQLLQGFKVQTIYFTEFIIQ